MSEARRNPGTLGCAPLLDGVHPRGGLFLDRLCRNNWAAKVCQLHKLMLDSLESLVPPSVSDLDIRFIPAVMPELLIQLLNVGYLHSEPPNLVSKNLQMIHVISDYLSGRFNKQG